MIYQNIAFLDTTMFFFKKCSLDECCIPHICSAKDLENDMFSTLHHLPFPMKKLGDEKFKHFDEVYGEITSEGNAARSNRKREK